jgi:hypothetical protein
MIRRLAGVSAQNMSTLLHINLVGGDARDSLVAILIALSQFKWRQRDLQTTTERIRR